MFVPQDNSGTLGLSGEFEVELEPSQLGLTGCRPKSMRHLKKNKEYFDPFSTSLKDKGFLKGNKESLKIFKDFLTPVSVSLLVDFLPC